MRPQSLTTAKVGTQMTAAGVDRSALGAGNAFCVHVFVGFMVGFVGITTDKRCFRHSQLAVPRFLYWVRVGLLLGYDW